MSFSRREFLKAAIILSGGTAAGMFPPSCENQVVTSPAKQGNEPAQKSSGELASSREIELAYLKNYLNTSIPQEFNPEKKSIGTLIAEEGGIITVGEYRRTGRVVEKLGLWGRKYPKEASFGEEPSYRLSYGADINTLYIVNVEYPQKLESFAVRLIEGEWTFSIASETANGKTTRYIQFPGEK